ncbi:MAG TPA: biopolymer transporter ExbD, partial [Syntrophales bacterium]|nr:biopolymer transporter ExbD [Syntrophales bacterium]
MKLKRHLTRKARIEIIPMIDVVFFLLVFSMLTSLAMATIGAPPVNVPEVQTSEKGSQIRVFVTLTRDKGLYVNDKQIKATEL